MYLQIEHTTNYETKGKKKKNDPAIEPTTNLQEIQDRAIY